ncbi:MAG: hypothetical protein SFX18_16250 [Pirellulales bacterium]|nr:hypothetical protein [Pirellulales bacterium]
MKSKIFADHFDAPITSDKHRGLRDDARLGGSHVEAPYWLGRLLNRNFFRLDWADFIQALNEYLEDIVSPSVAKVLTSISGLDLATKVLMYAARDLLDFPQKQLTREMTGLFMLAQNPELSNEDLAKKLKTTPKQVARMTNVNYLRVLLRRQAEYPGSL